MEISMTRKTVRRRISGEQTSACLRKHRWLRTDCVALHRTHCVFSSVHHIVPDVEIKYTCVENSAFATHGSEKSWKHKACPRESIRSIEFSLSLQKLGFSLVVLVCCENRSRTFSSLFEIKCFSDVTFENSF